MSDETFNKYLLNNSSFLYNLLYSGRYHNQLLGLLEEHSAGVKLLESTDSPRWYDVWAEILISANAVLMEQP